LVVFTLAFAFTLSRGMTVTYVCPRSLDWV
jgi:hypothetical protein